jgi:hypothetical protein
VFTEAESNENNHGLLVRIACCQSFLFAAHNTLCFGTLFFELLHPGMTAEQLQDGQHLPQVCMGPADYVQVPLLPSNSPLHVGIMNAMPKSSDMIQQKLLLS